MTTDLIYDQMITFPFQTDTLCVQIKGIKAPIKERDFVLLLDFGETTVKLPWSDSLQSYFHYFPDTQPKSSSNFDISLHAQVRSVMFSVKPWSSVAKSSARRDIFETIEISANGVAGEEMRSYEVRYSFNINQV